MGSRPSAPRAGSGRGPGRTLQAMHLGMGSFICACTGRIKWNSPSARDTGLVHVVHGSHRGFTPCCTPCKRDAPRAEQTGQMRIRPQAPAIAAPANTRAQAPRSSR